MYVAKKLQAEFKGIFTRFVPSPLSDSFYVFILYKGKGAALRISDHYTPMKLNFLRRESLFRGFKNMKEIPQYYLFSTTGVRSQNNFYYLSDTDQLVEDLVAYFKVS